MEWVFLAGFGDMGREWPRDVGRDKAVMARKSCMRSQLLLHPLVGGELAQALGDLPVVPLWFEKNVAKTHFKMCLFDTFINVVKTHL